MIRSWRIRIHLKLNAKFGSSLAKCYRATLVAMKLNKGRVFKIDTKLWMESTMSVWFMKHIMKCHYINGIKYEGTSDILYSEQKNELINFCVSIL